MTNSKASKAKNLKVLMTMNVDQAYKALFAARDAGDLAGMTAARKQIARKNALLNSK